MFTLDSEFDAKPRRFASLSHPRGWLAKRREAIRPRDDLDRWFDGQSGHRNLAISLPLDPKSPTLGIGRIDPAASLPGDRRQLAEDQYGEPS
jgi:hypothetical protein